ncbi:cysteine desulfurase sulfur acceptor subunit CsdE [Sodalis sp. dw_96]|uniref:cysteine desulfurase sulfur acceptor subunit CsdE n=1 Tax=Sodalis sp. dw_96 TaxID=2719794 RepID=UPI001BD2E63C|nr:cysteine desulfurase sulfur acceptor subunit CsdE [Sodalis sp. dw_96]
MNESTSDRHPFGHAITLEEVKERFSRCHRWEDRLRQIILLAKALPELPEALKTPENALTRCENRVWLGHVRLEDGSLHFYAASDGRIVKGLLAIVLTAVEGKTPQQLAGQDPLAPFDALGLRAELSASRAGGLAAIAGRINAIVDSYLAG